MSRSFRQIKQDVYTLLNVNPVSLTSVTDQVKDKYPNFDLRKKISWLEIESAELVKQLAVARSGAINVIVSFPRKDIVSKRGERTLSLADAVSKDGINFLQAMKFFRTFKMTNLRMVNGYWFATDDDVNDAYAISSDNYYGALYEGDLIDNVDDLV